WSSDVCSSDLVGRLGCYSFWGRQKYRRQKLEQYKCGVQFPSGREYALPRICGEGRVLSGFISYRGYPCEQGYDDTCYAEPATGIHGRRQVCVGEHLLRFRQA